MISRAALLDELVKIGEEAKTVEEPPKKGSLRQALKAMAVGAAGGSVGYGIAHMMGKKMDFFQKPNAQRAGYAKIILPILGGTAAMLAERYRHKMNEQYSKVKGFKVPEKRP